MNLTSRFVRYIWLLGLVVVLGSAAGASWVLYSRAADGPAGETRETSRPESDSSQIIACGLGHVGIRHVTPGLYPVQNGRVEKVLAEEGQQVEEGAILLSVDKEPAENLIKQAQTALEDARVQLERARKLVAVQPLREAEQKLSIEEAKHKVQTAELAVTRKEELVAAGAPGINQTDVRISKADVERAKIGVQAEEKKLEELKVDDPALQVRRAEQEVAAKQAQVEQAQKALRECDLRAPSSGIILRVNVGKGDVLGPNPRQPAILFLPNEPFLVRAELDQETAGRVKLGMPVEIEDYTKSGIRWRGRIDAIPGSFLPRRPQALEQFSINPDEARFLECLISLEPSPTPPIFGQRVRVKIRGSAP